MDDDGRCATSAPHCSTWDVETSLSDFTGVLPFASVPYECVARCSGTFECFLLWFAVDAHGERQTGRPPGDEWKQDAHNVVHTLHMSIVPALIVTTLPAKKYFASSTGDP